MLKWVFALCMIAVAVAFLGGMRMNFEAKSPSQLITFHKRDRIVDFEDWKQKVNTQYDASHLKRKSMAASEKAERDRYNESLKRIQ